MKKADFVQLLQYRYGDFVVSVKPDYNNGFTMKLDAGDRVITVSMHYDDTDYCTVHRYDTVESKWLNNYHRATFDFATSTIDAWLVD